MFDLRGALRPGRQPRRKRRVAAFRIAEREHRHRTLRMMTHGPANAIKTAPAVGIIGAGDTGEAYNDQDEAAALNPVLPNTAIQLFSLKGNIAAGVVLAIIATRTLKAKHRSSDRSSDSRRQVRAYSIAQRTRAIPKCALHSGD